jgi:hypothetical protein
MNAASNDIFAAILDSPIPVRALINRRLSTDKEQRRVHRVMDIASLEEPAIAPV